MEESVGLKYRKRILKRQDAIDCEENAAERNPLVQNVLAYFKEKRTDLDDSVFEFIKEFCMERTKRQFLSVDKLVPPALDDEVANTITELTEVLNKDPKKEVYAIIKDLQAGDKDQTPEGGAAAKDKKLHKD